MPTTGSTHISAQSASAWTTEPTLAARRSTPPSRLRRAKEGAKAAKAEANTDVIAPGVASLESAGEWCPRRTNCKAGERRSQRRR